MYPYGTASDLQLFWLFSTFQDHFQSMDSRIYAIIPVRVSKTLMQITALPLVSFVHIIMLRLFLPWHQECRTSFKIDCRCQFWQKKFLSLAYYTSEKPSEFIHPFFHSWWRQRKQDFITEKTSNQFFTLLSEVRLLEKQSHIKKDVSAKFKKISLLKNHCEQLFHFHWEERRQKEVTKNNHK